MLIQDVIINLTGPSEWLALKLLSLQCSLSTAETDAEPKIEK